MEQQEIAYFNNLLLDNIELPVDITLVSTPKEVIIEAKIENYIDQKFDQAALKHWKFQILNRNKK